MGPDRASDTSHEVAESMWCSEESYYQRCHLPSCARNADLTQAVSLARVFLSKHNNYEDLPELSSLGQVEESDRFCFSGT